MWTRLGPPTIVPMSNQTNTQTVAELRSTQTVWTTWLDLATAGLAESDLVLVTRKVTAFGSFVLAVEAVAS